MLAALSIFRSNGVPCLCLVALWTIALPAAGEASQNEPRPGSSAVLAEGHELREGLASLSTLPNGILGSYEHEGEILYFETRRGPRTPSLLRKSDPTTPKFEIDVQFMNREGQPFLLQIGGHAPVDETWVESTVEFRDDAGPKSDFVLAAKAIESLAKVTFAREFKHEYRALLDLAPLVASAQVIEKIAEGPDSAISTPKLLAGSTYRHKVEIHDKSCCFGLGRHSATIGKYISTSGVTTTAVITCNHGTCAHQMPQKCSWTSPANRSSHVHNHVSCSTPYNPTSVFGHNSNDDTDLQYKAVRENFHPSSTGGTCNSSSRNNLPTNCY
jgi:hypothetical protein